MSNHYTVFDRHNERVGFAQIQDCTEGLQLANHPCSVSLPENAQWNDCSSTLSDGSSCEFTCNDGYEVDGPSGEIVCHAGSLDHLVQCVVRWFDTTMPLCHACPWPRNSVERVLCLLAGVPVSLFFRSLSARFVLHMAATTQCKRIRVLRRSRR